MGSRVLLCQWSCFETIWVSHLPLVHLSVIKEGDYPHLFDMDGCGQTCTGLYKLFLFYFSNHFYFYFHSNWLCKCIFNIISFHFISFVLSDLIFTDLNFEMCLWHVSPMKKGITLWCICIDPSTLKYYFFYFFFIGLCSGFVCVIFVTVRACLQDSSALKLEKQAYFSKAY